MDDGIKLYARFNGEGIQVETSQALEKPTRNTEDGSVWYEVDSLFPDTKHLIHNNGNPRPMTDEEYAEWEAGINYTGALNVARARRDSLLKLSDWTETAPMSDEKREEWRVYRQALRDLPETVTDYNIVYPVEPTL